MVLDRRKLIVCPHEPPPSGTLIMATVPIIWASAFAMASPLAIWKKLENWTEFPDGFVRYVPMWMVTRLECVPLSMWRSPTPEILNFCSELRN